MRDSRGSRLPSSSSDRCPRGAPPSLFRAADGLPLGQSRRTCARATHSSGKSSMRKGSAYTSSVRCRRTTTTRAWSSGGHAAARCEEDRRSPCSLAHCLVRFPSPQ